MLAYFRKLLLINGIEVFINDICNPSSLFMESLPSVALRLKDLVLPRLHNALIVPLVKKESLPDLLVITLVTRVWQAKGEQFFILWVLVSFLLS